METGQYKRRSSLSLLSTESSEPSRLHDSTAVQNSCPPEPLRAEVSKLVVSRDVSDDIVSPNNITIPTIFAQHPPQKILQSSGNKNSNSQQHEVDFEHGSIAHLSQWIPDIDPSNQMKRFTYYSRRRKFVLWTAFVIVFVVFITNLSMTILLYVIDLPRSESIYTVHEGNCTLVNGLSTGLHLIINILSTLMLGACSICMQLLSAPTRSQVDIAHQKGNWADIGVPSFRNLRIISWQCKVIWMLFLLTSTPIHFLYNSVVFTSVASNAIVYSVVSDNYFNEAPWNLTGNAPTATQKYTVPLFNSDEYGANSFPIFDIKSWPNVPKLHNDYIKNPSLYVKLSTYECLLNTSQAFQWRSNVIFVTSSTDRTLLASGSSPTWTFNGSLRDWGTNTYTANVLFKGLCTSFRSADGRFADCERISAIDPSSLETMYFGRWHYKIDYCLVSTGSLVPDTKHKVQSCHLQAVPIMLCTVTCFNFVKCLCILALIFHNRKVDSLATIGDAVASFLETPDCTTRMLGRTTKSFIVSCRGSWRSEAGAAYTYQRNSERWYKTTSLRRWCFVHVTYFIVLAGAIALMTSGFRTVSIYSRSRINFSTIRKLGWGELNTLALVAWADTNKTTLAILKNVLFTNIWQVLISYLYFAQNTLLTSFVIADEWARFAIERKSLRVSTPKGIQRSTFTLTLPLRYSLPMQVAFALLHYFVSQSTFVVGIQAYPLDGQQPSEWTTAGFSLAPMIASALMAIVIGKTLICISFLKRLPDSPMPLVSSCSVAISAACHPPAADKNAHLLPIKWGIVGEYENGASRCTFTTSLKVRPLESEDLILGTPEEHAKLKKRRSSHGWSWTNLHMRNNRSRRRPKTGDV